MFVTANITGYYHIDAFCDPRSKWRNQIRIELVRNLFGPKELVIVTAGSICVTAFCFDTGVEAVRIQTARMNLVVLPFLGQQIWTAIVDGRDIGMRSAIRCPKQNVSFLENAGAFFFHCGLTAIAAPGKDDNHPLHGELPNAALDTAWIEVTRDANDFIALKIGGEWEHAALFGSHYKFRPSITVAEGSGWFNIDVEVENLSRNPMDLCYLGHINFRPVDGANLIYSALYRPETVIIRQSMPQHVESSGRYGQLLSNLAIEPSLHHIISDTVGFDPEIVFKIEYIADEHGWAHGLQKHPDGTADWVSHQPAQFPHAFRWISRTPDQDCLAITEPATCGLDGYRLEKKIGRVPAIGAGDTWTARMRVGCLGADETTALASEIDKICGRL